MLNIDLINKIMKLTESIKIKSFKIVLNEKETTIDYSNIKTFIKEIKDTNNKIIISKKYFKLFDNKEQLLLIENCLSDDFKYKIFTNNEKLILLNSISVHSMEQYIKRSLLFYKKYGSEKDLSSREFIELKKIYNDSNKLSKKDVLLDNKIYLENLILNKLKSTKVLHETNMGRERDKKEFAKRDNKYKESLRLLNHPFLFIINDRNLVTIELFSSSFNVRFLNKKTSCF